MYECYETFMMAWTFNMILTLGAEYVKGHNFVGLKQLVMSSSIRGSTTHCESWALPFGGFLVLKVCICELVYDQTTVSVQFLLNSDFVCYRHLVEN